MMQDLCVLCFCFSGGLNCKGQLTRENTYQMPYGIRQTADVSYGVLPLLAGVSPGPSSGGRSRGRGGSPVQASANVTSAKRCARVCVRTCVSVKVQEGSKLRTRGGLLPSSRPEAAEGGRPL